MTQTPLPRTINCYSIFCDIFLALLMPVMQGLGRGVSPVVIADICQRCLAGGNLMSVIETVMPKVAVVFDLWFLLICLQNFGKFE